MVRTEPTSFRTTSSCSFVHFPYFPPSSFPSWSSLSLSLSLKSHVQLATRLVMVILPLEFLSNPPHLFSFPLSLPILVPCDVYDSSQLKLFSLYSTSSPSYHLYNFLEAVARIGFLMPQVLSCPCLCLTKYPYVSSLPTAKCLDSLICYIRSSEFGH